MDHLLDAHLTFHLAGRGAVTAVECPELTDERPALLARYRDLSALRYDFPLVLGDDGRVVALSAAMDGLLQELAAGDDDRRLRCHVLRLERRIRQLAALGNSGARLSALWDLATLQLQVDRDGALRESLERARAALKIDGEVVDCNAALAVRLFRHVWRTAQTARADQFHREADALIHGLGEILHSDFAASPDGRSAAELRAGVGTLHRDDFDFEAMSRVLSRAAAPARLPERRRERIDSALSVLRNQRFFSRGDDGYGFSFTSGVAALEAYWARRERLRELVTAIELARFELAGARHDAAHERLADAVEAAPASLAMAASSDYLVMLDADAIDPTEQQAIMDSLTAGLPMKVLVQTNDVLDLGPFGRGHVGFGAPGRRLVDMAIGLNDVYVLQAPASHLLQRLEAIRAGVAHTGPAVFNVFSGATGYAGNLPPYLVAAAALESRAFPTFVYDPSAGPDWASRLSLAGNPQPAAEWPVYPLTCENAEHHGVSEDLAFTLVDFAAADDRYAGHFARIERHAWHDRMRPVAEMLAGGPLDRPEGVPYVSAVNAGGRLSRLLVEDVLLQEASRCRDRWRSLQELGGVNSAHDRRVVEPERSEPPRPPAQATATPAEVVTEAGTPGGPYIETPRCSTCNECIQINGRMFAYNENKQAYIADPAAGTYRQLVEAAESCQVSIIHPGRPRNPAEPGLEELLARAEAFS
jgi:hypothetical protein